jgi:hypothetical protein
MERQSYVLTFTVARMDRLFESLCWTDQALTDILSRAVF